MHEYFLDVTFVYHSRVILSPQASSSTGSTAAGLGTTDCFDAPCMELIKINKSSDVVCQVFPHNTFFNYIRQPLTEAGMIMVIPLFNDVYIYYLSQ